MLRRALAALGSIATFPWSSAGQAGIADPLPRPPRVALVRPMLLDRSEGKVRDRVSPAS
jgi:hypothetical protein